MTDAPLQLAAVIFPGFELLDLYGPLELFGMLGERLKVSIVAERAGVVPSSQIPSGYADAAMDEVPSADIVLVPGGLGTRRETSNPRLLDYLRQLSASAKYVTSVCTGSALLAKAGILDGHRATSNKRAFSWVIQQGPHVQWVRQARWVEDGRFFTSSGVSAGMDMALALIERIYGAEVRQEVAQRAEYTWHQDSSVDPFASPDEASAKRSCAS